MADNATNQITAAQAAAAAASGIPSPGQSTPPPSPHILDNTMFGPVSADAAAYAAPATASLDAKTPSPFDKIPGQFLIF